MDLQLQDKLYVITGATSGFGRAIAEALITEDAHIIINGRREEKLLELQRQYPDQIEIVAGDITTDATISKLVNTVGQRDLAGLVVNAGGPPAMSFVKSNISDWDDAYESILRWKVKLTKELLPVLQKDNSGRIVYIESASVKQPIENLVLSNSLRLAVVGFVKTLSNEVGHTGITMNIIAPGYHNTAAMDRLFANKSETLNISKEAAKENFESEILAGQMGEPEDLASLACWLLSPYSKYITGQTISVDGGLIKSVFS
ncbi:SDR family oxidoreductase [Saprospiraceae bacterium]|nr:SDR family oxidoreductase [Saprospiraceae bacterium]